MLHDKEALEELKHVLEGMGNPAALMVPQILENSPPDVVRWFAASRLDIANVFDGFGYEILRKPDKRRASTSVWGHIYVRSDLPEGEKLIAARNLLRRLKEGRS